VESFYNLLELFKTRKAIPLYFYFDMASCETDCYRLIFTI